MKRISLGIIIIAVLMLVGCNNVVTDRQNDASTGTIGTEIKENSEIAAMEQPDQINSSTSSPASSLSTNQSNNSSSSLASSSSISLSNYIKTYEDETHKEIQYGKLSFSIGAYHIVSDTYSDSIETVKCEIDKGRVHYLDKANITIKVQTMDNQALSDTESIVAYLNSKYPDYERIKIYSNVADDSGIVSLYIITEGELTKYVVCYSDAWYLIESDVDDIYLFKNSPSAYYEVNNQKIECADSFTTYVNNVSYFYDNEVRKAEYDIVQGKNGSRYSAELIREEGYQYHFNLKNENGDNMLTLSIFSDFYEAVKILDVNMDGYADFRFCEAMGTLNNCYVLYVWDNAAENFAKVKYDGMLSYFEVHDGYLKVWGKNDADSGVVEKLVWKDMYTLVKESEEPYRVGGNNINELVDGGLKIFEDQSFTTEFENFGEVRFVTGGIEGDYPFEIRLYLTDKNGNIIYTLPYFYGNQWPMLVEVSAVAFKDVNKDGLKDIIIIASYMTGVGEHGAEEFPVAGVYLQKGKEFVYIPEINVQINQQGRNESIDAVIKFVNSIDLSKYNF